MIPMNGDDLNESMAGFYNSMKDAWTGANSAGTMTYDSPGADAEATAAAIAARWAFLLKI